MSDDNFITVRVDLNVLRQYVKKHPEYKGLLERRKRQSLVDIMLREANKQ